MVYYRKWTEYEAAAVDLYNGAPNKVRYSVKFRPKEGKLVLKITDDVKCLKYKTHSSIILNRFETLNGRLLTLMAAPTPVAAAPAPAEEQQAEEGDVSMADVSMTVAREGTPAPETPGGGAKKGGNAPGGGTGGGVSKKKKKGKR